MLNMTNIQERFLLSLPSQIPPMLLQRQPCSDYFPPQTSFPILDLYINGIIKKVFLCKVFFLIQLFSTFIHITVCDNNFLLLSSILLYVYNTFSLFACFLITGLHQDFFFFKQNHQHSFAKMEAWVHRKVCPIRESYFNTDIVQNCWNTMIKSRLIILRFILVFKFSTCNVPTYCLYLGELFPPLIMSPILKHH